MRDANELSTTLADVLEERSLSSSPDYYEGCAAALEWVIRGHQGVAPVSGPHAEPTAAAELGRAIAMQHGEEQPSHPRAYLSGVEATLAWVLGQTDEPPL